MGERNNPLMKKLDKWLGCPLLFGLGIFHKKSHKPDIKAINLLQIAIVKTAGIGDTIVLSAVVDEIRHQHPQAKIVFICAKNNAGMVKALHNIDCIYEFDMHKPLKSLINISKLGHFDLALDFGPWPRINAIISYFIDADYRIGFKRKNQYRHYIYDAVVEHSDNLHEIENYRNIIRKAGFVVDGLLPDLHCNSKFTDYKNYVIFHMHAGGAISFLREWDDANWIALAKLVYKKYKAKIIFSGGKADWDSVNRIVISLEQCNVEAYNIAGEYSLTDMAAVLQNAKLLVSVNTGTMHYGAAVGVPLVAIHGANPIKRWGPLSKNSISLASDRMCCPCVSLGFETECTEAKCMQDIRVENVMRAISTLLKY